MTLSTVCRRCGREFAPDPDAIRAGTWQRCPQCRENQPEPPQDPIKKETTSDA